VASFADLVVSAPGNGYTLTGAATDLPPSSLPSSPFDVQQDGAQCAKHNGCNTHANSANFMTTDQGINATVSVSSGSSDDVLAESTDFGTQPTASECEGYTATHDVYWNLVGATDRTKQVSITTTVLAGVTGSMIKGQDNCLLAPFPFTEINESTNPPSLTPAPATTLPDGSSGFAGLLPDCGKKNLQVDPTTNPCVVSRTGTNTLSGGTLTITISIPAGEPGDPHSLG
jgi:hypothetical protein